MTRRTCAQALTIALLAALLGCGVETSELAAEPMGWPEAEGEPGMGRFMIEGQALELAYLTLQGHRMFEGDIILDDEPELLDDSPATAAGDEEVGGAVESLFAVGSDSNLWPRGRIPYVIHSSVSTPGRIRQAMRIWEATGVDFVPRTTQRAYVTFIEKPGHSVCSAQVGYNGGHRYVYLRDTAAGDDACNLGVDVHEIGHVLGLWHEHTRPDRDRYVRINWRFVPSAYHEAYDIKRSGVRRVGAYDITSSMHYRSTTLSARGGSAITRRDGSRLLHDWATLSRGDVAAIRTLYFDGTPVPRPDAAAPETAVPDAGAADAGAPDAGAPYAGEPVPSTFPDVSVDSSGFPIEVLDAPDDEDTGADIEVDRTIQGSCSVAAGRGSPIVALFFAVCLVMLAAGRARTVRRKRRNA